MYFRQPSAMIFKIISMANNDVKTRLLYSSALVSDFGWPWYSMPIDNVLMTMAERTMRRKYLLATKLETSRRILIKYDKQYRSNNRVIFEGFFFWGISSSSSSLSSPSSSSSLSFFRSSWRWHSQKWMLLLRLAGSTSRFWTTLLADERVFVSEQIMCVTSRDFFRRLRGSLGTKSGVNGVFFPGPWPNFSSSTIGLGGCVESMISDSSGLAAGASTTNGLIDAGVDRCAGTDNDSAGW